MTKSNQCRHYISLPRILSDLEIDWKRQMAQYPERREYCDGMAKAFLIARWAVLNEFKREFVRSQIEDSVY